MKNKKTMLMVFRAFNGGFGASMFPVTIALVGQSFNDKERQGGAW